ncbi:MAG: S41 family peptidase [Planctomycetaceae bacterium]|jgi:carboxyl-terminal processing protease|nr:S41 family peptidase [Planctomycetaceae bacterium]MBT6156510.1 S41 family peptidase [Planctomycetaceae bacterium]MBT6485412.1 S41 family peptidase [Planctomycetaceae bacterium]MBT6497208.1 S41 family peptidase [Planctomycetaceae bacterium]
MARRSMHWFRMIAVGACVFALVAPSQAADKKDDDYYELMRVFVDTFEQIDRNYVKDVDRRELMEAAIKGMLAKLDQYSSYISKKDLARFTQEVEQEFGGIGIQVSLDPKTNRLTVMTPLPGTPAYKAGVRAGDVIMEIEGKSTEGFQIDDAVKLLKGKAGQKVTLGVKHVGADDVVTLEMKRAIIKVATVLGDKYNADSTWNFWRDEEQKIGYIRLSHFSRHSAEELTAALKTLKAGGVKGLVLDLRFNPGGLLSQAVKISDLFVESGKIVSTKGRNTPERTWNAKKPGTYSDVPMVILVNRYSASASEILSACLQDHKRAVIVGERTWGKGSVQNVINLEDGASALKLTTASYHRPSGKNIHRFPGAKDTDEWGVMPDENYKLRFTNEQLRDYLDYRRERDVLSKEGPPKSDFKDEQLAKALEFLSGKLGKDAAAEKKTESDKKTDAKTSSTAPKKTAKAIKQTAAARRFESLRRAMRAATVKYRVYVGSAS